MTEVSFEEFMRFLPPLVPNFPLSNAPMCRHCERYGVRLIVRPSNPNGNAGRPFYRCESIRCRQLEDEGWLTWDDNIGVHASNPRCDCGIPSRRNYAGISSCVAGQMFWRCADCTCEYRSYDESGMTPAERALRL